MRTKTCKNILNHFLNGGKFTDYKGDIVLADGTTLTYADWLGKNTDTNAGPRYIQAYRMDNSDWNHCHAVFFNEYNRDPFLLYIFPFMGTYMQKLTSKPSANSDFMYSYTTSGGGRYGTVHNTMIFFGSEDTEESDDDYALKSGLDNVVLSDVSNNGRADSYITLTVKNWNTEEVTIKEMGAFVAITVNRNYAPVDEKLANSNAIMLARLVLDNPVTIAGGEIGQIYIK